MSLLPPRCFACNKPLRHLEEYLKAIEDGRGVDITLDILGYTRMCCRSHYITYPVDLENILKKYDPTTISGNGRVDMKKM